MKKIKRWFNSTFSPEDFNGLDMAEIVEGLNDPEVRRDWLAGLFDDLKQLHIDVDRALLSGKDFVLTDLCAKRQMLQKVLESVLQAKRNIRRGATHNPRVGVGGIDLDRVTV